MQIINIILVFALFVGCTSTSSQQASEMVIGTYSSPPHNGDTILYDTLISQLEDLNCNTYNWLIMPNEKSYEQLKEFLPVAQKKGIEVWATLIPPVELASMAVGEYSTNDMRIWAAQLAGLSVKYPNFKAWTIDDFTHSVKLYTPKYVSEFQTIAKKINPGFKFYPVCYYKGMYPKFVSLYGSIIDGIVFPYRNESVEKNLTDPSHVASEINEIRNRFGRELPIFLDVYSSAHSKLGEPSPEFISKVIESGIQQADGIIIFRHPSPRWDSKKYEIVKTSIAKGLKEKK